MTGILGDAGHRGGGPATHLDCLLVAPTASGKTEAAVLPLLSLAADTINRRLADPRSAQVRIGMPILDRTSS